MPISALILFKDYDGGQGVGIDNYYDYPEDLDADHTAIENWAAEVTDAINAFQGSVASLFLELLTATSPTVSEGRMGTHSLSAAITGGGGTLTIDGGSALVLGDRTVSAGAVLPPSTVDGAKWIAMSVGGLLTLEASSGLSDIDLYTVTETASVFTNLAALAAILPDGDDFQALRKHPGTNPGYPAATWDGIVDRVNETERISKVDSKSATINLAAGDATLTLEEAGQLKLIEVGGGLTANRKLWFPVETDSFYWIRNSTSNAWDVLIDVTGSPGLILTLPRNERGEWVLVHVDGIAGVTRPDMAREQAVSTDDSGTAALDVAHQEIQRGWDFVNGSGSIEQSFTVTFPRAFSGAAAYDIVAMVIGSKVGSDPSSRSDLPAAADDVDVQHDGDGTRSASQCSLLVRNMNSGTLTSGTRYGFSWIAIGTV
jgi:hypothetical protein